MQLRVGSYIIEGFVPSFTRDVIRSDRGFAQRIRATLGIKGDFIASSATEMTAAINDLFDNIGGDYNDIVILDDDGDETPFKLINGDSIDGTKMIQPPTFPDLNVIYSLRVPYEIVWQADFSVEDVTNGTGDVSLLEFTETVQWQGNGGPLKRIELTPDGDPIEFTVARKTPYFATQTGSMTSRQPIQRIPEPIWPDKQVGTGNGRGQSSPNVRNGVVESYSASWSYSFQSITPLIGQPTQRL